MILLMEFPASCVPVRHIQRSLIESERSPRLDKGKSSNALDTLSYPVLVVGLEGKAHIVSYSFWVRSMLPTAQTASSFERMPEVPTPFESKVCAKVVN